MASSRLAQPCLLWGTPYKRHINATLMLSYGVPAKIDSERLGHSSINITMDLCSHVTANMQKDVKKIENGIFKNISETNN